MLCESQPFRAGDLLWKNQVFLESLENFCVSAGYELCKVLVWTLLCSERF